MAVVVSGTSITFNDATVQSTAAGTPTTLYAIGSYITGRPANITNYTADSTIAGSLLYNLSVGAIRSNNNTFYGVTDSQNTGTPTPNGAVLVNTGTWRCMSPAAGAVIAASGLWVRIS
jgi:hypothetical protein